MRIAGAAWLSLAAVLAGCDPPMEYIDVSGRLYACDDTATCGGLAGATVRVRDVDTALHDQVKTDADGDFTLHDVPGDSIVFITADNAEGYVSTTFIGVTGNVDGSLPDGALFAVSVEEAETMIDAFAAAHPEGAVPQEIDPKRPGNGGMARGRFLIQVEGLDSDQWPGAENVSCYFEDGDAEQYPCVYLDKDGVPDWDASTTTYDGGFAAFGLPPGALTLVILYGPVDTAEYYTWTFAYVEEDGIVVFDDIVSPF